MKESPVIIIYGMPGVGKTGISGHIARKFGIDVMLCGDYLREFVRPMIKGVDAYAAMNFTSYDTWKLFGEQSMGNIVKGYAAQSKIMSAGINALIDRALKNGESIVIETMYLSPEVMPSLKKEGVTNICLYVSDKKRYEAMLLSRDKFSHAKSPGNRLVQNIDVYKALMEYLTETCKQNGIPIFDNLDYAATRDSVTKFVEERISAQG